MEYIYIGEIVNTHGIKGEIRILSDFKYKKEIFVKDNYLYIGRSKEKLCIATYRHHKIYDMVTFDGINNINDVLIYKGEKVYINKEELNLNVIFDEDLIEMEVYSKEKYIGKVDTILKGVRNDNLVVIKGKIKNLIPNIPEFIEKVDLKSKKIYIKEIEGLINED